MPFQPNVDVVERRLAFQRDLLADLDGVRPLMAARLEQEPLTRAAVERIMQAVVDLALDINGHIAASVLGRAPGTGRESFDAMAAAGVVSHDLADRLKPSVGLRNVLVHMYADIDVALIASAADELHDAFSEYVRAVAEWLTRDRPE